MKAKGTKKTQARTHAGRNCGNTTPALLQSWRPALRGRARARSRVRAAEPSRARCHWRNPPRRAPELPRTRPDPQREPRKPPAPPPPGLGSSATSPLRTQRHPPSPPQRRVQTQAPRSQRRGLLPVKQGAPPPKRDPPPRTNLSGATRRLRKLRPPPPRLEQVLRPRKRPPSSSQRSLSRPTRPNQNPRKLVRWRRCPGPSPRSRDPPRIRRARRRASRPTAMLCCRRWLPSRCCRTTWVHSPPPLQCRARKGTLKGRRKRQLGRGICKKRILMLKPSPDPPLPPPSFLKTPRNKPGSKFSSRMMHTPKLAWPSAQTSL
mmetsp:Transcript_17450/g.33350  ORF Transcript_17450/g.33350 Transcript_17450/m.33350 type:complete len:319 (+) Transcript_17450:1349-2305(+)